MKPILSFLLLTLLYACHPAKQQTGSAQQKTPDTFVARFETSKGNFDIEVTRSWSPLAADRLYRLLGEHFYDHTLFYRVVPEFVVQFGNNDTSIAGRWDRDSLPDEP